MATKEIKECFYLALHNLRSRQLRSWLTIIGIVIGIFLIISLLSLSEGLKATVMTQLKMMGGDLIIVMPGDTSDMFTSIMGGLELKNADLSIIERTRGVEEVVITPYAAEVARYEGEAKITFLAGVAWEKSISILQENMGWETIEGDFPRAGRREILIANLVSKDIFPGIGTGDEIMIKGRKFTVSGILKSLGSKQDDSMIILDLEDFKSITGKREGAPMAMVKVASGFEVDEVASNLKTALEDSGKRRMGEDAPAFSVLTSETVSDMVGNIMGIIQLVVIAFASIAIIVGGTGIMNTMYTSVRERTREIGIMKAVGVKNSTILSIFLIESAIIGIIGGLGGTLLGIVLAKSVEMYGNAHPVFYISASVTPGLIIFGLFFSLLVGGLSGFFPAKRAAQLKPVEALRRFE